VNVNSVVLALFTLVGSAFLYVTYDNPFSRDRLVNYRELLFPMDLP
jgi:ABC-type maltose transport system permease subunit